RWTDVRRLAAVAIVLGLVGPAAGEEAGLPEWLQGLRVRGRLAEEFAYRLHDPGDVAKLKTLGWLEGKYTFSEAANLRVATRGWDDPGFDGADRHPVTVAQ